MKTPRQQQFINELLQKETLTKKQREKVLELLFRDFGSDKELRERVEKIEEVVFSDVSGSQTIKSNGSNVVEGQDVLDFFGFGEEEVPATNGQDSIAVSKSITEKKTTVLKPYIDPYKLYQYLFHYNQNPVLRTTCHDMDADNINEIRELCKTDTYEFPKHLELIVNEFNVHSNKYFGKIVVPQIRAYLTGKKFNGKPAEPWSGDKITTNWSHPDVLQWAEKNPGIPPNYSNALLAGIGNEGLQIEQIYSAKTGKVISNFTDLVIHFKHMFHIRADNSLHEILKRVNNNAGWNDKIEFDISESSFPKNIEHFTDVDKLTQGYNKLLNLVCEQLLEGEKPKVKLRFYETDNGVNLSIHHLNSVYNKTVQNTLHRMGKTYTDLIDRQLNSLCNLYLRADFGEGGSAFVNLWDAKEREHRKLDGFRGVEHVLAFPKISDKNIDNLRIEGNDICY